MDIKILAGLLCSGLITAGAAQATATPVDTPAVLSISGKVSSPDKGCRVGLSKQSLFFNMNIADVITQGDDATQPQIVTVNIQDNVPDGTFCTQAVKDGKIAIKFVGQADTGDGTAVANQYPEADSAATGIGFGLFKDDNSPIAINSDSLKVTEIGTASNMGKVNFGVQPVKLNNQTVAAGMISGSVTVEIERL